MAATRLIPLHVNKGQSVARCLSDRINYAENPNKTQEGRHITSYQCDARTADKEFLLSKTIYFQRTGRNAGDVIAYQIRQSFKPGEITPEEANEIGYELAMRFTKGRHAFVVCTHTDRAHIHNHIIFNSTSLDCESKFQNFFLSSFAIQRISDHICLAHGLSIISPLPYGKRKKRTEYPNQPTIRDRVRQDIDTILKKDPKSMDELLRLLTEYGYEIKQGKFISVKAPEQKRFVRLKTLGKGYTDQDLKERFQDPVQNRSDRVDSRHCRIGVRGDFSLLIDVQEKLRQGKDTGYIRWAKRFNLKQMAKVLLYLQDHGINDYEELVQRADNVSARYDQLAASIKVAEGKLNEIADLKKHIFNYSRTKDVYAAYRNSGYNKQYYEEHRDELARYKAAKDAFNQLDSRIPRIKELNEEYARVLEQKKKDYAEYRTARDEMKELVMARKNVEILLELDESTEEYGHRSEIGNRIATIRKDNGYSHHYEDVDM